MTDTDNKITREQFNNAVQIMKSIDDFRVQAQKKTSSKKYQAAFDNFNDAVKIANTFMDYYVPKANKGTTAQQNVESIVDQLFDEEFKQSYDDLLGAVLIPFIYGKTIPQLGDKYALSETKLQKANKARVNLKLPAMQTMPTFIMDAYMDTVRPAFTVIGSDNLKRYYARAAEIKLSASDTIGYLAFKLALKDDSEDQTEEAKEVKYQSLIIKAEVEFGHALGEYIDDARYYDGRKQEKAKIRAKKRIAFGKKVDSKTGL